MQQTKPIRKSLKPCKEFGCGKLTRNSYCKSHEKIAQEITRETNRQYNNVVRDPKVDSFYKSRQWQRVRTLAVERDNHLCQWCVGRGVLQRVQVVHHMIEVKEDWSRRLELNNLISLCHSCHNNHHKKGTPHGRKF